VHNDRERKIVMPCIA